MRAATQNAWMCVKSESRRENADDIKLNLVMNHSLGQRMQPEKEHAGS